MYTPCHAAQLAAEAISRGERVGYRFGSEKNRLSNEELRATNAIVTVPTTPRFDSLNLAQAVLLIEYEWPSTAPMVEFAVQTSTSPTATDSPRATPKQMDALLDFWGRALWGAGFFGDLAGDKTRAEGETGNEAGGSDRSGVVDAEAVSKLQPQYTLRAAAAMASSGHSC